MGKLVRWLHEAEKRSLGVVYKRQNKLEKENGALTAQRRFGDAFVPKVAKRSPGAFEIASTTVFSGVSKNFFKASLDPATKGIVGTIRNRIPAPGSPEAQLNAILDETGHGSRTTSVSPLSEAGD